MLAQLNVMLDDIIQRFAIPTQSCILTHVTNTLQLIERGAPVDLVFQSVAGTEAANSGFGINLAMLQEAREAALSLGRGTLGNNVMYFETGGELPVGQRPPRRRPADLRGAGLRRRPPL